MAASTEKVVYSEKAVRRRVEEMGEAINAQYAGRELVVLTVMTGGFMFCADLVRQLQDVDVFLDFITVRSYYDNKKSRHFVQFPQWKPDPALYRGRNVLVIDDIYDTGETLNRILAGFEGMHSGKNAVEELKTAVLVRKRNPDQMPLEVDYVGFEFTDKAYVYGYGMDDRDHRRHRPHIARAQK